MKILSASKNCNLIDAETPISAAFRECVDTWYDLRDGADQPIWQIDHLMMFPPPLVPYANVTRWEPGISDHRFIFWGSGRTDMMNFNYTSRPLSELQPNVYADLVRSELIEVLAAGVPMKSTAKVRLSDGTTTKVDKVRLPFRSSDGELTTVLSFDDVEQFLKRYYLSWARPMSREQEKDAVVE